MRLGLDVKELKMMDLWGPYVLLRRLTPQAIKEAEERNASFVLHPSDMAALGIKVRVITGKEAQNEKGGYFDIRRT